MIRWVTSRKSEGLKYDAVETKYGGILVWKESKNTRVPAVVCFFFFKANDESWSINIKTYFVIRELPALNVLSLILNQTFSQCRANSLFALHDITYGLLIGLVVWEHGRKNGVKGLDQSRWRNVIRSHGKWRTWCKIMIYNTFIVIILYMFRATVCSSSGGQIVLIQHMV